MRPADGSHIIVQRRQAARDTGAGHRQAEIAGDELVDTRYAIGFLEP